MTTVKGSDLKVGDLLAFLGHTHRVVRLEPYPGIPGQIPPGRIAICEGDWRMAIYPEARVPVQR